MSNVTNKIVNARRVMWNELENDPGFRLGYEANVAMLLHDELHTRGYKPKLKFTDRNEIATALLKRIFNS